MVSPGKFYSNQIIILASLTLLAAIIRFYHLGYDGLWWDEAWTLFFSRQSFFAIPLMDVHPPLFYWIEYGARMTLGESEFALRFFPAVFSILTVPALYVLGRDTLDWKTGIVAAAIFTVSPLMIHHAQDARCYSLALLLFVTCLIFYIRAGKTGERKNWYLFSLCAALTLWTTYPMAVPVSVIFLHALITHRNQIRHVLFSLAAFIGLTFLLAFLMLQAYLTKSGSGETFGEQGLTLITNTLMGFGDSSTLLTILILTLATIGLITLWYREKPLASLYLMLLVIPLAIGLIAAGHIPFIPRYFLFMYPLYLVLIGCTLDESRGIGSKVYFLSILFIIASFTLPFGSLVAPAPDPDWTQFNATLSGYTEDNGTVMVLGITPFYTQVTYYYDNATDHTRIIKPESYTEFVKQMESHPDLIILPVNVTDKDLTMKYIKENTTFLTEMNGYLFKPIP